MGETLTPPAPPPDYSEELEQEAAGIAARRSAVPPEFRTQPAPPRAPRTGTEALIEGLPPSMQPIAQEQLRILQQTGGGGSQVATARRDLELARGEREAREQYAQQYGERLRRYEGERIATPDFLPTPENAMSLGTLFGLIATAGTLLGTKGNQSAMGALQAMNGMMTGWRQGRADLYNRERQNFETEMRRVQAQNEQLRRGFEDDLKLMRTNMDAGMARARERAAQAGVSIASAGAARQGAQAYLSWLSSLQSTMAQIERHRQSASNTAPIVVPRQNADGTTSFYYAHRDGSPIMGQDGQPLAAPPPRSAVVGGAGAGGPGATETRQRRDIRGQIRLLEDYMTPDEVQNLGNREIPAVTSRIESAELSARLAEEVRRNPQAAGIAARIIRRLETLDPTRYGGNLQESTFGTLVSSLFGRSIENEQIEGPADAVTKARQIAKLAVDVINARALAASGGSRMLVSELNLQKGVIGLEGLTPDSAPSVYQRLADDDIAAMRRYGISYDRLAEIKRSVNEKAREYVRSGGLLPPEREARGSTPTTTEREPQPPPEAFNNMTEGQERTFRNGQVWRIENGVPVRVR